MPLPMERAAADDSEPMLVVVEGLEPGRRFPLRAGETTIGRRAGHHVVLPSPAVSNDHARIEARDGQFWIEDLESTNGVAVNGGRVAADQPRRLGNGDAIRISDHLLLFHHGSAARATVAQTIEIDRAAAEATVEELLKEIRQPRTNGTPAGPAS
jgi:pSer/pThr/pTyr-binding forkhead associated (FHA) protein